MPAGDPRADLWNLDRTLADLYFSYKQKGTEPGPQFQWILRAMCIDQVSGNQMIAGFWGGSDS